MSGPPPPIGKILFFSALDLICGSRFPRSSPAEEIPQSVPLDHRLVLPKPLPYGEYREARDEMKELLLVKANIDTIMGKDGKAHDDPQKKKPNRQ